MTQRRPSRPPARPLLRLLMVAVPVLVLLGGAVSEASAARIKGPKRVKPGKVITLRVSGLRSGQEFSISIQPSTTPKDRLGLDGALIQSDIRGKGLQGNSSGRAVVRIRFPKRRQARSHAGANQGRQALHSPAQAERGPRGCVRGNRGQAADLERVCVLR